MPPGAALRQLELFSDFIGESAAVDSPAETSDPDRIPSDLGEIEARLNDEATNLSASLGLDDLARKVSVHWNPRMRTTAGRALFDELRIELNPGLLRLSGIDCPAEVDRTLRHELAHLVAHVRARGRRIDPHGREWRRACSDLGIPGESRCHTLPFQSRQIRRKYTYVCPACDTRIPRVRKFRRTVACWSCCEQHNGGRYDDRFRLHLRKENSDRKTQKSR